MNYTIITDEAALIKFINWLPILQNHETYYLCLFARSKYVREQGVVHIKADKQQLKRFCSKKENMIEKILQLECEIGSYTQKGMPMPQEALGLYITMNPRNMWKASFNLMGDLASSLSKGPESFMNFNPYQEALSAIQKCKSRSCFVTFDVDKIYESEQAFRFAFANHTYGKINHEAVMCIQTRGGFHVLIMPDFIEERYRKTWYSTIASFPDIDQSGDLMSPVPGTYQGGFTPRFI